MGDIFSTKKNTTNNTVLNQQVALQGRGQIGVSGSQITGDINVSSSDPEVVLSALQVAGQSTQANAVVSARAIDASRENSARALDLANTSILQSGVSLGKTLDFLQATQARGLETVDSAVQAAQQTALLATPQSPAAYGEITGGQNNKLILGAIILAVVGYAVLKHH